MAGARVNRKGLWIAISVLFLVLAGCNRQAGTETAPSSEVQQAVPPKPAATADEHVWGVYLAEQGKRHGKDVGIHPYIYVIPAGDDVAAKQRRQNEAESVIHGVGPLIMPGGILILGGPAPSQTTRFVVDVAKQLSANALKGVIVLVVSAPAEKATLQDALKATGATVRFIAM